MHRIGLLLFAVGILAGAVNSEAADKTPVSETEIGAATWMDSNTQLLRSFGKNDVAEFLTSQGVHWSGDEEMKPIDIRQFKWADLPGSGQANLVIVFWSYGSALNNYLSVYQRTPAGEISAQSIDGFDIDLDGNSEVAIPPAIQDLNGDGRDELVIPTLFCDTWGSGPKAIWPKVYELKDRKYVDASRDFTDFYDKQVLPKLDSLLKEADQKVANLSPSNEPLTPAAHEVIEEWRFGVARRTMLIMSRDKILRFLGRDPTAGLAQARAWFNGTFLERHAAYLVIKDIGGGHEEDLQAAKLAMQKLTLPNADAMLGAGSGNK